MSVQSAHVMSYWFCQCWGSIGSTAKPGGLAWAPAGPTTSAAAATASTPGNRLGAASLDNLIAPTAPSGLPMIGYM
jgi:hypothetical protein